MFVALSRHCGLGLGEMKENFQIGQELILDNDSSKIKVTVTEVKGLSLIVEDEFGNSHEISYDGLELIFGSTTNEAL